MGQRQVWIYGCGYLGREVAAAERAAGAVVGALTRTAASAAVLSETGIAAAAVDLDRGGALPAGVADACLYYFVPPPATGAVDPRLAGVIERLGDQRPRRVVLVGTSGVYGDCGGRWVDESRAPAPAQDRSRRRLDAENRLRAWAEARGVPWVVLRVAGIYGPGRLPAERLRQGLPVLREAESPWSNRVHLADLVQGCLAAGADGAATGLFNVADGHPSTMTDYFNRVADHLGLPRPPQISLQQARAQLSAGMLGYLTESRRLKVDRLRRELGVRMLYPDLALGLAACGTGPD